MKDCGRILQVLQEMQLAIINITEQIKNIDRKFEVTDQNAKEYLIIDVCSLLRQVNEIRVICLNALIRSSI